MRNEVKYLSNVYHLLTPEEKEDSTFDQIFSILKRNEARFKVMEHEHEGQSDKIALIRGNEPKQGAKAILTVASKSKQEQSYHLLVLSGNEGIDFGKLKKLLDCKNVTMSSTEDLESLTKCVRGAVPPFSFNPKINLLVDESLISNNEEIVFNAGRLDRSIFLNVKDYMRIVKPFLVNIRKV
jgi:Ala-tRNA(Pro) deacylase